jgi:hypothetical protein
MRVQVEVVCAPHRHKKVKDALQQAGERLALKADSVSVDIDPENPHIAVLSFEMRRAAQYKVVDKFESVRSMAKFRLGRYPLPITWESTFDDIPVQPPPLEVDVMVKCLKCFISQGDSRASEAADAST